MIREIGAQLEGYALPFPRTVLLIKTTGREEGDAAYCRENAIVLPASDVARPRGLKRLLTHELFHILSSHSPPLRDRLYAIVGFRRCPAVPLPDSLRDRAITNPDAPGREHYIRVEADGQPVDAVPILFSQALRYDPQRGGTFFRYLQFRLMVVAPDGQNWKPQLTDGEPILLDPRTLDSYHRQIGANTQYIIHPEEILADNFVHLVLNTTNLKTPRIVDDMRKLLAKP